MTVDELNQRLEAAVSTTIRVMVDLYADELPQLEIAREKGKWIDGKCNRCGKHAPFWAMSTAYYCSEYCPKCGAKMEVDNG